MKLAPLLKLYQNKALAKSVITHKNDHLNPTIDLPFMKATESTREQKYY